VEQVNQQLPEGKRFGHLAWSVPKSLRLLRDYSRLYPDENLLNLLRKQSVLFGLAFGCLFLSAWCLGFFRQWHPKRCSRAGLNESTACKSRLQPPHQGHARSSVGRKMQAQGVRSSVLHALWLPALAAS